MKAATIHPFESPSLTQYLRQRSFACLKLTLACQRRALGRYTIH